MIENNDLLKVEESKKARLKEFNFPDWLTCECFGCSLSLSPEDILSFEVHFEPMFLGDMSFSFFCKNCSSLMTFHLKCDVESPADVYRVLTSKKMVGHLVDRNTLLKNSTHNILDNLLD